MELLVIALLIGFAFEESRIAKKNADFKRLQQAQGRLMQEFQAVESQVADLWLVRASYELECQ
jgi:hypothetical protein